MANLVLEKLSKSFGAVEVIPGLDLQIEDGEFVVFVGPSGCGKSTLLRLIAGLEEATAGDIRIAGESVISVPAADRGVAMVFQSYALYPHMTVRQNLSFGLENIRMPKDEIARRVEAAAKMLQIEELLERRPKELSGGQRQRVAIGRAITRNPKIFLFDEPLSNLDAELRVLMRVEITKLHERLGNTMIYVTHDQIEAMTMADKIVVLRKGVIEQVGAPLELYNHPRNLFVAGFIGSPRMNFLNGAITRVSEAGLSFQSPHLPPFTLPARPGPLRAGATVTLGVRPEHFTLSENGTGWPLTVSVSEQHGSNSYLHCATPDGTPVLIHEAGQSRVARGDVLHAEPREGHWHLFDAAGLRVPLGN
ncbi:ABC transporter ATP-binding protein [Chelativorans salis]|uniref:Sn-glycerol-3-phosphate ABC transporter ATP-binding protein UgpC n=1 Tax=Chelativorans salis TaxID=2978478 RepID=A0ABT2LQ95_9HYPH|nr:sn-glycerol-3-phosphate ABC transporter ATP-binding protein UgpC [Chelativorans sp. EGI FJ00035]MCT7376667.1 sn-glycerol-3-phosphate ABC transporter ATP-binding protein UgpC [Chelativorans sp. EGI FJ00035]